MQQIQAKCVKVKKQPNGSTVASFSPVTGKHGVTSGDDFEICICDEYDVPDLSKPSKIVNGKAAHETKKIIEDPQLEAGKTYRIRIFEMPSDAPAADAPKKAKKK